MSLDYSTITRRSILETSLILELDKYRYLPLHLVFLYLSITKEHKTFYFSDLRLSTKVDKEDPSLLGIFLGHHGREYRATYGDPQLMLAGLKLREPHDGVLHLFKTPIYPDCRPSKATVENEKDIIFARNKTIKRLITSLVSLEDGAFKDNYIPFYLAIPYLFYNKDKKLIFTAPNSGQPVEFQYDPQNVSLRTKESGGGSIYGNNYSQDTFLILFERYLALNLEGRQDGRNLGQEFIYFIRTYETYYPFI